MTSSPSPPTETTDPDQLLIIWSDRCRISLDANYQTAVRLDFLHRWSGVTVVIINAVVGTAVFASLSKQADSPGASLMRAGAGLVSVLAAVLTAVQTSQKFGERAERHRQAGTRFSELKRQTEL